MDIRRQLEELRLRVDEALSRCFVGEVPYQTLYRAMAYSLNAGGKRVRPILTMLFCQAAGGDPDRAMELGCGVEMLHTYSLIHDDLPCMDNDDLRRGKPTNHKVYGETLAVLAGDALQPEAYRLILTAPGLDESRRAACGRILAEVSGADGMVAGQVLDTLHAPKTEAEVTEVHRLKTGAMIAGACRLGVAAAGGSGGLMAAAETYAQELGLAFQIRDDMLDVCGDAAEFGKPIGSDKEEGKVTFMDLLGLEGCGRAVRAHTEAAKAAVADWDTDGFLAALADSLAERNK